MQRVLPGADDDVIISNGSDVGPSVDPVTIRSLHLDRTPLSIGPAPYRVTTDVVSNGVIYIQTKAVGGKARVGLTVGGTLFNTGFFGMMYPGAAVVGGLVNTGDVGIFGTATASSVLTVADVAGDGIVGHLRGAYKVYTNAAVRFRSGQITTLDGTLDLRGDAVVADASDPTHNSALHGLSSIGVGAALLMADRVVIATVGALANSGTISLDASFDNRLVRGSRLTVGGALSNAGTMLIGNFATTDDEITSAASVLNTGTIRLRNGDYSGHQDSLFRHAAFMQAAGSFVNRGALSLASGSYLQASSYTQSSTGSLDLDTRTVAPRTNVQLREGLTLDGGTLSVTFNDVLAGGEAMTLATFAPGHLSGMFDKIVVHLSYYGEREPPGDRYASGTTARPPDSGVFVGVTYDNALGTITARAVNALSTTVDTVVERGGAWTASDTWSSGVPTFYSDAVIGHSSVVLTTDATVNSIALKAGASLATASGTDLSVGATLAVTAGASLVIGGQATVDSAFTNDGKVAVGPGGLVDIRGNAGGSGFFTIGAGATLIFRAADANTVVFGGTNATLEIDRADDFKGTLANLVAGDALDLAGVEVASASDDGRTLTVLKADTSTATFTLSNKQVGSTFAVQDDGAGGSRLVLRPPTPTFPPFSGAWVDGGTRHNDPSLAVAKAEPFVAATDNGGLLIDRPLFVLA